MTQGPWSVKGIDPKARSVARDRAQRQGVTLGQYLNSLLLDDDGAPIEDLSLADPSPRRIGAGELGRMSNEIDMLSQRLEASQARSARAVSGLDKSILSLMGKVEASGKAQLGGLERVTRAMTEIEATQAALRTRIETLESDSGSGPTLDALKTLEASLGHLGQTVQDRFGAMEQDQAQFRSLFDEKVERVSGKVDEFARSIDQSIADAIRNSSSGLVGRVDQIERQERTLESNFSRTRQMSKEVLDRVDDIEEKTREAVTGLNDAVARITERLSRAERKSDTAISVLERSVNEIDDKLSRKRSAPDDFAQIQSLFQKRLDSLAEDLSRPIHAVRADVERRLEEALRSGSSSPEKLDRLERSLRQVQEQVQVSEARQADAVEAMSAQVERLSRAVDERLRAVESRGDARSIEDVRREMLRLADTIDVRLGVVDSLRNDIGRLNTSVDDRIQALEQRSASAIDAVGEQVTVVAERLQRRHEDSLRQLGARIDEAPASRQLDGADMDRLADRLDERVRDSERRSAEAIGQIGEQVARVADRLQSQHLESLRSLEARLADSGRSHEARLNEVLADMQRRMDEVGEHSASALTPVHKTVSSLARRLEGLEDGSGLRQGGAPAVSRDIPAVTDEFVFIEDLDQSTATRPVSPAALAAVDAEPEGGVVGVEPPPFDRGDARDSHLFGDGPKADDTTPVEAQPARSIEDLLDTDDVVLDGPPPGSESIVSLFADNTSERATPSYIEAARRAAREGRPAAVAATGRRGLGKGPLIGATVLAVAVAGGGAMTVMRGKQDARADDFAKLDPASPAPAVAAPGAADAVLFDDASSAGSTGTPTPEDLFEPTPLAVAAPPPPPVVTLADAVREGDPVALHDQALELLQTGEKARAVQLLKDAAGRGLVMAEYRLAKLYEKGEGVPRDMAAARSWTEKAAIGGNTKAMHDVAVFYAEGDAGPQSYAAAVEWFRQASDLGLVDSQYNLAVLYEQGLGVSQDKSEAAYWFEVAGRAGDPDAARRARAMFSDMATAQADQIKRRARAFNPKPPIGRANGDLGKRPWDAATPSQVAEVQRLLEQLGYSPGAADGKTSAQTQNAIRAFEADNELPMTGEPSVTLLRQLRTAMTASGE